MEKQADPEDLFNDAAGSDQSEQPSVTIAGAEPNDPAMGGEPTQAADDTLTTDDTLAVEEAPWWDDPSLPWRHKPTRADLICWALIAVVGVYSLVVTPLRPALIGWWPPGAAMITGGRTSVVTTGAWAHVLGGPLIVYWLVATLSLVKFSWVYWWAGQLWGANIIELLAGKSKRTKRSADRAVRVTNRFALLAIFLSFVFLPMPIVFAAIGAAKTPLQRFLPPVIIISAVFQAGYLGLGWWLGEPVVTVVDLYARYMMYLSIAILVGMVVAWWWRRRKQSQSAAV